MAFKDLFEFLERDDVPAAQMKRGLALSRATRFFLGALEDNLPPNEAAEKAIGAARNAVKRANVVFLNACHKQTTDKDR